MFGKKANSWFGSSEKAPFETTAVGRAWLPQQKKTELRTTTIEKQVIRISKENLKEYISLRETENLTKKWLYQINLFLTDYLKYCDFEISKNQTIQYLNSIRSIYHQTTYRKRILQIRKFLQDNNIDWLDKIKIVPMPVYRPQRVTDSDIKACLAYFEGNKFELQARAVISLRYTGLRPTEIYRLTEKEIDFSTNRIDVKTSKTGQPRTVFFNNEVREAMIKYIQNKPKRLRYLFGEVHCRRMFTKAPLQIKMLRKWFFQEWNRRNGNYLIGELIGGHSIRGNVTLGHYTAFSLEEMQKEYNRVFN